MSCSCPCSQTHNSPASFLIRRNRSEQEYEGPSQGHVWLCDPGSPLPGDDTVWPSKPLTSVGTGRPASRINTRHSQPKGPRGSLGSKATCFPVCSLGGGPCRLHGVSQPGTSALRVSLSYRRLWGSEPCGHSHGYLLLPGASPSTRPQLNSSPRHGNGTWAHGRNQESPHSSLVLHMAG